MIELAGSDEYFATAESQDLASHMQNKISEWREWCSSRGFNSLWMRKLSNYYGISEGGNTSQRTTAGGSEGELTLMKVNDLHNLIQNQLVMVTSQRPAGQARAINSDIQSLKSARIGTAIAEYYMSQIGWESKFVQVTETALLCDEAYIDLFWDKSGGDPIAVDPETGIPEMSGDCILRTHAPWNVARDPGLKLEQQKWKILTYRANKWDMAALYPKFADQILNCGQENVSEVPMDKIPEGSDALYCHLLVHDRTPAVPNGRYSLMIGSDIVVDTDLPYKDYPIKRIAPSDVIDGCIGYSSANDILGLEELTDALHSIIATNEITFGGQNIIGPEGCNLKHSDIAKGVRFFELPPEQVPLLRPLELCRTPVEVFNYIQMLSTKKEQAVGVNSVVRGQPEGQLAGASGSALALIQTQAIAFNSGIQKSYATLLSDSMSALISILRTYADTPRVAKIVGKSKQAGLKEFKYTGQDLDSISSIVYELVNPISQTFGGRLTLAQDLIKANMIKSPKQYINVVTTGQTDVLTEDDEADGLLILEENEALQDGKPIQAVITEMHVDHIKSHMSVISSVSAKQDIDLVQRTTEHIQQHIDLWMQASAQNPGILMATGQQPLMPPPPPPPPPPGLSDQLSGQLSGVSPNNSKVSPQGIGKMIGGAEPPAQMRANGISEAQLPTVAGSNQKPVIPGVNS